MKITTSLHINGCDLFVYLGATDDERAQQQRISLNLQITFPSLIKACQSDNLDDTICYQTLRDNLQEALLDREFNLIEHLGWYLTESVLMHYPEATINQLELTKYPPSSHIKEAKFIMTAEA
ncbi:dihydroneopterin aldolase [Thiotrichales bacterium 19S11-10]|nr:dihydroneopterin aldolase [Thiotrichales bacterium 19S11-10]MCF6808404.1 dihydroneopterin aldolase [Thiotrichales bacterium 19S9-11]MCF6812374.1 dihydroneopterin aldolase [Thiotrichales bacterium 19S9-12]